MRLQFSNENLSFSSSVLFGGTFYEYASGIEIGDDGSVYIVGDDRGDWLTQIDQR